MTMMRMSILPIPLLRVLGEHDPLLLGWAGVRLGRLHLAFRDRLPGRNTEVFMQKPLMGLLDVDA
jgi:hypothetical protein